MALVNVLAAIVEGRPADHATRTAIAGIAKDNRLEEGLKPADGSGGKTGQPTKKREQKYTSGAYIYTPCRSIYWYNYNFKRIYMHLTNLRPHTRACCLGVLQALQTGTVARRC